MRHGPAASYPLAFPVKRITQNTQFEGQYSCQRPSNPCMGPPRRALTAEPRCSQGVPRRQISRFPGMPAAAGRKERFASCRHGCAGSAQGLFPAGRVAAEVLSRGGRLGRHSRPTHKCLPPVPDCGQSATAPNAGVSRSPSASAVPAVDIQPRFPADRGDETAGFGSTP